MANNDGKSPLRQAIRPGLTFVQVLDYKTARELYNEGLLYWKETDMGDPWSATGLWDFTFGPTNHAWIQPEVLFGIMEED